MKYALIIILIVVLMALSFTAGWLIPKGQPSVDESKSDDNLKENGSEKKAVNVFFSPKTGSDETGDGSQNKPFETKEKAISHSELMLINPDEEIVILEFLMSVDVKTQNGYGVSNVFMIPFTGSSQGYYFNGEIVGTGCDTQKYGMGSPVFSARYMLKGKDYTGKECSIFIENEGDALDKCTPTIITDSIALSQWQSYNLRSIVTPIGTGVIVDIYRIHQ